MLLFSSRKINCTYVMNVCGIIIFYLKETFIFIVSHNLTNAFTTYATIDLSRENRNINFYFDENRIKWLTIRFFYFCENVRTFCASYEEKLIASM